MPCKNGIRDSIESSKALHKNQRELDKTDPMRKLWLSLVHRVHDSECGYESLSDPEKKYFAVGLLDGEVFNGGFDQYFFNSSADHFYDAERGLKDMGALQALDLLLRAKQVLFDFDAVPTNTGTRRIILQQKASISRSERLEKLDQLYWGDPDSLAARSQDFLKIHRLITTS